MNKLLKILFFAFLLTILFVFDKSFAGIFPIFSYFSLSVLFMYILLNTQRLDDYIFIFFFFGFLIDYYNKSFFGLSSLILCLLAFIYYSIREKILANIVALTVLDFVIVYLVIVASINIRNVISFDALIQALWLCGSVLVVRIIK